MYRTLTPRQLKSGTLLCALTFSSSVLADVYHYDKLNRLIQVTYSSGDSLYYTYDAAGNLLSVRSNIEITTYSFVGSIQHGDTHRALSGVVVNLGSLSTTTNNDGYFAFSGVVAGEYQLVANLDGYQFDARTINVNRNTEDNVIIGTPDVAPRYAFVGEIRIKQTYSHQTLSGIVVNLGSLSTITNDYGYFKFYDVAAGKYQLVASLDGYQFKARTVNVNRNTEDNVIYGTPDVAPRYSVQGRIEQTYSHQVLSGVVVNLGSLSTTTDENGHFTFSDVAAGEYPLVAALDGYSFEAQTVDVSQDIEINFVGIGQDTACVLYAVHDEGRKDSQFFVVSNDFKSTLLGNLHLSKDIEALDIDPITDRIYAAAGDDGDKAGWLYTVNAHDGGLNLIGSTGFNEINGLSFTSDGQLWGWADSAGLIQIDTATGEGSLIVSYTGDIEDMTWNNSDDVLYLVQNSTFYAYSALAQTIEPIGCELPAGEIEAIEMLPNGNLLFAIHDDDAMSIYSLDLDNCEVLSAYAETKVQDVILNDVEGIAWPTSVCQ
ncbi:carboxypeptidase regulatory-like domain-containing protein [Candidatus Albibeggiatoa sp. nov. BB20]|uniref:carboxypeptidase regulatory-like domain-containing protein n=1 Tax=Candidatus Albibeggiatoa sp. nov. BB20 TaxID=3162723 RepID=UPI00336558DC